MFTSYLSLKLHRGCQRSIDNVLNIRELLASNPTCMGKYIEILSYNCRWFYIFFQSLQPLLLGPCISILEILSSWWIDSIKSVSWALDKFLILKLTLLNSHKTIMRNEKEVIYIYEHTYFFSFHPYVGLSLH